MLLLVRAIGLEYFLILDDQICPCFITEYYHSFVLNKDPINEYRSIEFKLGAFTFELTITELIRIFKTPDRGNKDHVNASTTYMLYYLVIGKTFDLTSFIVLRMDDVKKNSNVLMPYAMFLTRLFKHILKTNPQSIIPFDRFTLHKRVMNSVNIRKRNIKNKGKRAAPSSPFSSPSSNEDKEPSFLTFYEELPNDTDLSEAQKEKRGMFKCQN
ncbi:hypothetical protein Tco_0520753 [Tanacetum coccineum]